MLRVDSAFVLRTDEKGGAGYQHRDYEEGCGRNPKPQLQRVQAGNGVHVQCVGDQAEFAFVDGDVASSQEEEDGEHRVEQPREQEHQTDMGHAQVCHYKRQQGPGDSVEENVRLEQESKVVLVQV